MDRRVEELAERVEEQDPRQDAGEDFELRVVVLQVHHLVSDHRLDFLPVEQRQEAPGDEDCRIGPADRHGERSVRFDHPDLGVGYAFELAEHLHEVREPRLVLAEIAGRELPEDCGVSVLPDDGGDHR